MKIKILKEEWWPVYSIDDYGHECEADKDTVEEWLKVFREFEHAQRKLRECLEKQIAAEKAINPYNKSGQTH